MRKKYFFALILIAFFFYAGKEIFNPFSKTDSYDANILQTHESAPIGEVKSRVEVGPSPVAEKLSATSAESKNDESFESHSASRLGAKELLDRKTDEDPDEEIKGMHHLDNRSGEGRMLLGKFLDEKNKIELFIALAGEDGADHVCLAGPAISFKKKSGSYILAVDASGYGIVKLSETEFLRLAWFIEERRMIMGQLFKIEKSQVKLIEEFSVSETADLKNCN